MKLGEAFLMALGSLKRNGLRSLLTLLGVIIGIAAVITILTLGAAASQKMINSINNIGGSDFQVAVEARPKEGQGDNEGNPNTNFYMDSATIPDSSRITPEMVDKLRLRFGDDLYGVTVAGFGGLSGQAVDPNAFDALSADPIDLSVTGVGPDYFKMNDKHVEFGREITQEDIDSEANVTVISHEVFTKMYDSDPQRALGSSIQFDGPFGTELFTVVGVTAGSSGGMFSFDFDELFAPYTVVNKYKNEANAWPSIGVRPAPGVDSEEFGKKLQRFFDAMYEDDAAAQVKVRDSKSELQTLQKILTMISLVISSIAGISLLVGGIGIMNIMLVTVTERTSEIGIRKAVGATTRDIRVQFVVEAMIICLMGGIIGIIIGTVFGVGGAMVMKEFVLPPVWGIIASLLISLLIGVFFGFYPANKAAKLNPIDALRHE